MADADAVLLAILLAVPVAFAAFVIVLIARARTWVPRGAPSGALLLLTVCGGYAAIFLWLTAEALVIRPAAMQRRHLGMVIAGPLRLRAYRSQAFPDEGVAWSYHLSPAMLAAARARCRTVVPAGDWPERCVLYAQDDDVRRITGIEIIGDRLEISDGSLF